MGQSYPWGFSFNSDSFRFCFFLLSKSHINMKYSITVILYFILIWLNNNTITVKKKMWIGFWTQRHLFSEDTHLSATTLKPGTLQVNTIGQLVTMQHSPQKPWVLAFMVATWYTPPSQTLSETKYIPHWQRHSSMVMLPRQRVLTHFKNCSGMTKGVQQRDEVVDFDYNFLRFQSNQGSAGSHGTSHDCPTSHPKGHNDLPGWYQTPQDNTRGPVSMPHQVRTSLIHNWVSMDQAYFGTTHRCSIGLALDTFGD